MYDERQTEGQGLAPPEPSQAPIYNNVRKFKIFVAVSSVVMAILSGIIFGFYFDVNVSYFTGNVVGIVFFAVVISIAILSAIFASSPKSNCTPSERHAPRWLGVFAGLELLHLTVSFAVNRHWLLAMFSAFAIIFFISVANDNLPLNVFLGTITVLWGVVIVGYTYSDYAMAINSPFKLLCQFAIIFGVLLVICEMKFKLDKHSPKWYKFIASISFCLNLSATVANLAVSLNDALNSSGKFELSVYCFSVCGLAIYSAKFFFALPMCKKCSETYNNEDKQITATDFNGNTSQSTETNGEISEESENAQADTNNAKGERPDENDN